MIPHLGLTPLTVLKVIRSN